MSANTDLDSKVPHGAQRIARVAFRLAASYPASNLGNPPDPLDDLIYLVLSGQTNENNFQATFAQLKQAFPSWAELSGALVDEIRGHIAAGGLDHQKAVYIKSILAQIERDFGSATLVPLRDKTDREIEDYLTALPGVGVKTVRCVMMYAFDRDVFPADVHCLRILNRLGIVNWQGERGLTCGRSAGENSSTDSAFAARST